MNKHEPLSRHQWYVLAAAFLGWMFDGLEMGLYPLAARPALRDIMFHPSEALVGQWYSYLVALFLVGAAAGGFIFGWMGDKVGRVRTMALAIATYSVFTGCVYFAASPWQLGAFRFLAALGMGGEWSLGVALVMECWPERLRPVLAGVIGAAANFGFLSISILGILVTVSEESWRWMMLAGAAPGVLAVFVVLFIPESERWKESVRKVGGATRPVREIFTTKLLAPTLLGIAFASVALIGTWGAVSGFLPPWTDQLAGGDRVLAVTATVGTASQQPLDPVTLESVESASVSDSGSEGPNYQVRKSHEFLEPVQPGQQFTYKIIVTNRGTQAGADVTVRDHLPIDRLEPGSVSTNKPDQARLDPATGELVWNIGRLEYKDSSAKAWVQFVLSIGAILGCFIGPLLANAFGRRPAYFLLCLLSLISCAYLFRGLHEYNALFIAVTGFVGLVTASFYGWLPLYLPELFPTRVRATGQGIAFNSGRVLAAAGALTTGQLMQVFKGSYPQACATITLVYVFGMVLIWFAPETRGKPLPE